MTDRRVQIVITRKSPSTYKIMVMGSGKTLKSYNAGIAIAAQCVRDEMDLLETTPDVGAHD